MQNSSSTSVTLVESSPGSKPKATPTSCSTATASGGNSIATMPIRKRGGSAMFLPPRSVDPSLVMWCGRSWEGLVDRRCTAFAHALSMRAVTERTPIWSFRRFSRSSPRTEASSSPMKRNRFSVHSASTTSQRGCRVPTTLTSRSHLWSTSCPARTRQGAPTLRVVRRLGGLLKQHLLMEEEEIRPFVSRAPARLGRLRLASA